MPYAPGAINLVDKFAKFSKLWSPHIVAQMNDLHVKAVKVKNAFVWHQHDQTDELFFVQKGVLTIRHEDRDVTVRAGEMHVVPKGVRHKPVAKEECEILIIEPAGRFGACETLAEPPCRWAYSSKASAMTSGLLVK